MVPVVRTKQGLTEGFSEGEFQIPGVSLPNRESVNAVGGRLSPWLKGRGQEGSRLLKNLLFANGKISTSRIMTRLDCKS